MKWILVGAVVVVAVWRFGDRLVEWIVRLAGFSICVVLALWLQQRLAWGLVEWAGVPAVLAPLVAFVALLVGLGGVFRWIVVRARRPQLGDAEAVGLDVLRVALAVAGAMGLVAALLWSVAGQVTPVPWLWAGVVSALAAGVDVACPGSISQVASRRR